MAEVHTAEAKDIESLNKPDDTAHGAYNVSTLKDSDERDEDGHLKRTGGMQLALFECMLSRIQQQVAIRNR